MQKKIVLALIMSSSAILYAQEANQEQQSQDLAVEQAPPVAEQPALASQSEVSLAPTLEQQMPQEVATTGEQVSQPEPVPAPTMPVEEAPAAPAAVEQVQIPQEPSEEEEIEIKSLDTVNVNEPKGNWLYKRIWWEKAERLYEKIKQLADKIMEFRSVFFTRRHDLDHAVLDPFYLTLGVQQGELSEIISFFTQKLEEEKQNQTTMDEKEVALRKAITEEKKTLEQLQKDSQNVIKIEHALDDALMKLIEQLNQARYYEQQSWDNFKAINRELSDKRARELYYGMDTYWKNLNSINSYLSDAYTKYFDQLTSKLQQETDKINNAILGLKEKGIDIRAQAQLMKTTCKASVKETEEQIEEESTGILDTIWKVIKAPFSFVGDVVSGVFDWVSGFFGGSSSDEITLVKSPRATVNESIDIEQETEEDHE